MNHWGEFSTHTRDGEHVTKQLNSRHPAGSRFVTAVTRTGGPGMCSYLGTLCSANVRLPAELHIVTTDPLTIRHRWVTGPTLLDAVWTDPTVISAAVVQIRAYVPNRKIYSSRCSGHCAFDTPIILDALVGYALRAVLRTADAQVGFTVFVGQANRAQFVEQFVELIEDVSTKLRRLF